VYIFRLIICIFVIYNLGVLQMIKDSGTRREFESGAVRDMQEGKGRMDLLPACAIIRLAKHFENGANKYEERNWEKGIPTHSFIDSAIRHLMKYLDGATDEDHLCAAAWNCMCCMWTEEKRPDLIDIPTRMTNTEKRKDENDA
jgi:hypothetical protein